MLPFPFPLGQLTSSNCFIAHFLGLPCPLRFHIAGLPFIAASCRPLSPPFIHLEMVLGILPCHYSLRIGASGPPASGLLFGPVSLLFVYLPGRLLFVRTGVRAGPGPGLFASCLLYFHRALIITGLLRYWFAPLSFANCFRHAAIDFVSASGFQAAFWLLIGYYGFYLLLMAFAFSFAGRLHFIARLPLPPGIAWAAPQARLLIYLLLGFANWAFTFN